jgi:hypothetical protein
MKWLWQQKKTKEQGQIIAEYAVVLAMFIGVAITMLMLMAFFTEYTWRIISLLSLGYP